MTPIPILLMSFNRRIRGLTTQRVMWSEAVVINLNRLDLADGKKFPPEVEEWESVRSLFQLLTRWQANPPTPPKEGEGPVGWPLVFSLPKVP